MRGGVKRGENFLGWVSSQLGKDEIINLMTRTLIEAEAEIRSRCVATSGGDGQDCRETSG